MMSVLWVLGTVAHAGPPGEPLAHTSWNLVAFGEVGDTLEAVVVGPDPDHGPYELYFNGEGGHDYAQGRGLSADDGCNTHQAPYATATDSTLLTGKWVSTLLSCEQYPSDPAPFTRGLRHAESYERVGDDSLYVFYDGGQRVLLFESLSSGSGLGEAKQPSAVVQITAVSPNPFRETTTLHLTLERSGRVRVVVYDVLGRQVATLVDEMLPAGEHAVRWEAERHPAGTYVARVESRGEDVTRRLTLVH